MSKRALWPTLRSRRHICVTVDEETDQKEGGGSRRRKHREWRRRNAEKRLLSHSGAARKDVNKIIHSNQLKTTQQYLIREGAEERVHPAKDVGAHD